MTKQVSIIGAGLAGCEAAWQLAGRGFSVRLFEARPKWFSPAHKSENLAELVCSNSLKSEQEGHATALLKEEMRALGSLVIESAYANKVPAGKALAVDREGFSEYITQKICTHPNIELIREEVYSIEEVRSRKYEVGSIIIATGPLTSPLLADSMRLLLTNLGTYALTHSLYFYDSIAPIIESDSIDMDIAYRASRYGVGENEEGDYINCPLSKEGYYKFIEDILKAEKIRVHEFDELKCFEACMPIEVMAERHKDALRHGPMKPMGLENPRTGDMSYAVVQLRQDDLHATLFNMVGFQTRMTYPSQEGIFRQIPGLERAKFARLGSMHRNIYINGPLFLNGQLRLKSDPAILFAGQITGVEGYLESAVTGLYAGLSCCQIVMQSCSHAVVPSTARQQDSKTAGQFVVPPPTTAIGALINHVTTAGQKNYQPMNMIWGIFPPLDGFISTSKGPSRDVRKRLLLERARSDFAGWLKNIGR